MLQKVLHEAMRDRSLSSRQASKEIGVAHTTVLRVLDGQLPSHTTLIKVAAWLGTPAQAFALLGREGNEGIAAQLMVLLDKNKELAEQFGKVLTAYNDGKIGEAEVEDIIRYISFRLG